MLTDFDLTQYFKAVYLKAILYRLYSPYNIGHILSLYDYTSGLEMVLLDISIGREITVDCELIHCSELRRMDALALRVILSLFQYK